MDGDNRAGGVNGKPVDVVGSGVLSLLHWLSVSTLYNMHIIIMLLYCVYKITCYYPVKNEVSFCYLCSGTWSLVQMLKYQSVLSMQLYVIVYQ